MGLYLYVDRPSFFHRLDPRAKLFVLLCTFLLALVFSHPLWTLGVVALVVLHAVAARSWQNVRRAWPLFLSITLFSTLIWAFVAKGDRPLYVSLRPPFLASTSRAGRWRVSLRAGGTPERPLWRISSASIGFGFSTGLKLSAMVAAGLILLSTTRNEEIALGLIRLGVPYPIAFAFSTALRLVPTFVVTGAAVVEAQRARGLDLDEGSAFARMRKYVPLLGPIFLTTLRTANHFAMALESRGFGARRERTFVSTCRFDLRSAIAVALTLALAVGAVCMRMHGCGRIEGLVLPM